MKRRRLIQGVGAMSLGMLAWPGRGTRAAADGSIDSLVVGAGVFGVWTAWHLAKRGRRVALIDAVAPAHSAASSGGESRVIRCGYGDADLYTEWACRSIADWQALSDRASLALFHRTGVLWLHGEDDAYVAATAPVLRQHNIAFERLSAADIAARYPVIRLAPGEAGFLEPGSGALMARRAVQTLAAELASDGVTILRGRVQPVRSADAVGGSLPGVELADGRQVRAAQFVFACGPWLDKVCPDAMARRLFVTRQEVLFFADANAHAGALPVWADLPFYGCPSLEGRGFKVANDTHGAPSDPDTMDRSPDPRAEEKARQFLARRFPALADSPLSETRVCQYENSSNGDFVLDRHPGFDNVWLAGCGSGHGFKHGPAIGQHLAALMLGETAPLARFSLDTKARKQERAIQ